MSSVFARPAPPEPTASWHGVRAFRGRISSGDSFEVALAQPVTMITAHLSGGPIRGLHKVEGRRMAAPPMRSGSSAIIPPGLDVECQCDPAIVPLEYMTLTFPEDYVAGVDPDRNTPLTVSFEMNGDVAGVHSIMRQIASSIDFPDGEAGNLFRQHASVALLALASRSNGQVAKPSARPNGLAPHVLKRVMEMLVEDIGGDHRLNELAATANMSQFHFLRSFKAATGLPPHQWLLEQRVERAKELLKTPISIAQVALAVGFDDQGHFTRVFRRKTGVTPTVYRFAVLS